MTLANETNLTGTAAFVSGASSGIGRAIARALAAEGVRVTLCARRRDRLEAVAEEIREAGGEAHVETADFFQVNEIDNAIRGAADHWGGLDILINSAGTAKQAMLMDGDTQDWREMMDLNVLGLAVACREALKHFPESGGHVVNLGSMSGHRVPGRGGFYSATKFAVRALTEGLRQELRAAGNLHPRQQRLAGVRRYRVARSLLRTRHRRSDQIRRDPIRNPQTGRSRRRRDPSADDAGVRRDHRCPDASDGSGGVAEDAKFSGWKDAHS